MKPRLTYSAVFGLPDLSTLKEGDPLLLDGQRVEFAGKHEDRIVWLKVKRQVLWFKPDELVGRLRMW